MKKPLKVETTITTPYKLELSGDDLKHPQDGTLYVEFILGKLIKGQMPFKLEVKSTGTFTNFSMAEGTCQFIAIDEVAEKTVHTMRQVGPFFEGPAYEEYESCDCEIIDEEDYYEEGE